jgi:hypothetical protein
MANTNWTASAGWESVFPADGGPPQLRWSPPRSAYATWSSPGGGKKDVSRWVLHVDSKVRRSDSEEGLHSKEARSLHSHRIAHCPDDGLHYSTMHYALACLLCKEYWAGSLSLILAAHLTPNIWLPPARGDAELSCCCLRQLIVGRALQVDLARWIGFVQGQYDRQLATCATSS